MMHSQSSHLQWQWPGRTASDDDYRRIGPCATSPMSFSGRALVVASDAAPTHTQTTEQNSAHACCSHNTLNNSNRSSTQLYYSVITAKLLLNSRKQQDGVNGPGMWEWTQWRQWLMGALAATTADRRCSPVMLEHAVHCSTSININEIFRLRASTSMCFSCNDLESSDGVHACIGYSVFSTRTLHNVSCAVRDLDY